MGAKAGSTGMYEHKCALLHQNTGETCDGQPAGSTQLVCVQRLGGRRPGPGLPPLPQLVCIPPTWYVSVTSCPASRSCLTSSWLRPTSSGLSFLRMLYRM